jgi:hypothetical protein
MEKQPLINQTPEFVLEYTTQGVKDFIVKVEEMEKEVLNKINHLKVRELRQATNENQFFDKIGKVNAEIAQLGSFINKMMDLYSSTTNAKQNLRLEAILTNYDEKKQATARVINETVQSADYGSIKGKIMQIFGSKGKIVGSEEKETQPPPESSEQTLPPEPTVDPEAAERLRKFNERRAKQKEAAAKNKKTPPPNSNNKSVDPKDILGQVVVSPDPDIAPLNNLTINQKTMEKITPYSELAEKIKTATSIEEILLAIKDSPEDFSNRPGDKYQAVSVDKIIESFVAQIQNLKSSGVAFKDIDFDNTNFIGIPEDKDLRAKIRELAEETYNKYTPAPKPAAPAPAPKPSAPAAASAAATPQPAPANNPAQPQAPAAQPKVATGPATPKAPEMIPDDFFAGVKTFQEIMDKVKTLSKDSFFVDVDGNNLKASDVKRELARIFNLLEDNNFDKLAKLSAYKDKGPYPTKISLLEVVWDSIPENGGLKAAVGRAFSEIFTKFKPGQKKAPATAPAPAAAPAAAAPAPASAPKASISAPLGTPAAAPAMTPDQIKLNAEFAEKIKDAKTMKELIDLVKNTKIDFVRPNDEYMKYTVPNILTAFMAEIQNFKQYGEPIDDVVLLSTFLMGVPSDKGLRDKAKSLIPQIQKDYVIIPGLVKKTVLNTTPAPKSGPAKPAAPTAKPAAVTMPATPAAPTGAPVMPVAPESQKMIEDKNRIDELSKMGETPAEEVKARLKALETAKNWAEYFPYLDEARNMGILGGKETARILSENLENKKGSALITAVESLNKIVETEIIDRDGVAEVAEKFLGRLKDQNLWATYAGLLIKGVESGLFDVSEEKTVHLIREGMEGCHANKWVYSFRLLKDLVKKTNLLTTGVYTPEKAALGTAASPASPEAAPATAGETTTKESVRTGPKPPPIPGSKPSILEVEKDPLTLADLTAAKYDVSKVLKNKGFGEFLRNLGGDIFEEAFKDADKTEGMLKKYHEIYVKKNLLSKEVMTVMREKLGHFSDSKFAQIDSKLMELAISEPEKILKMYSSVERLQSARKGIKIAEAKLSSITGVAIDKIKGKYDDADLKAITEILKKQKHGSTGLGVFALWNSPAYWYRRYQLKKNYGVDVESLADLAYNTSRATWKAHNRFANETMAREFEEERAGIKDAFGVRTLEASKIAPHGSVRDNLTRVEVGEPGFDAKNKTKKNFGPGMWAKMMSGVANAASKVSEQVKNLVDWAGNSKVKMWDRSGHRSFDNVLNRILGDSASELNPSLDSVSKIESKYEQGRNELLASIFSEREVENMMKEESEKYLRSSMEKIFSAESDWNKLLEPLKEIISLEKELNGNIARGITRNILEIISDHIATEKDVVKRLALTSLFGQLSAFAGPVQAEDIDEDENEDEDEDEESEGAGDGKTPKTPKAPKSPKTPKVPKTPGTSTTPSAKKPAGKGGAKVKNVKTEEAETEYSPLDTGAPTSYEEEEIIDLGDGLFDEKMVSGANEVHYLVDKDGKKISNEKYESLAKDSEGRLIGRVYDKDGKKNDNWYILDPKTGNPLELADGLAKDTEVGKPKKVAPESPKAPLAPEVVPTAPATKPEEEPEYNPLENDRDAGDLSREPKVVTKAEASMVEEEVPETGEEVITPEVEVASEPIEKYSPDRSKKYSMNDTLDLGDGLLRKTVQHDDKLTYLLINKDGQAVSDYEYDDLVSNGKEVFGIFGDGKDDRIYSIDKTNGELIDMVETTEQSIPSPKYELETIPNLGHGMYDRTETVDGKVLHFITDIRGKKLLSGYSYEKLDLTHDRLFGLSAVDGEWYEINREIIEKEEKENEYILSPLGLGQYDLTEMLDDEVVHYVADMYGQKLYDRPYTKITKDKNGNLLSVDQNGKWWRIIR